MEQIYNFVLGPIEPTTPSQNIKVQVFFLKIQGFWPPKTDNKTTKQLYKIYGMVYRFFFCYLYTFTELMFFFTVTDLKAATNALYLLITEMALDYKIIIYLNQYDRMLVCYERLESDLFKPKNDDEKKIVKRQMLNGFSFGAYFFITAQIFILVWSITPFIDKENISKLPLAALYPYDPHSSTLIYVLTFFYQVIGCFFTSWINVSTDTLTASMLLHGITQLELLGLRLSKLGHDHKTKVDEIEYAKGSSENLELTRNRLHEELLECIKSHSELVNFITELEDIFTNSIFIQMLSSTTIFCVTEMGMIYADIGSFKFCVMFLYFVTMLSQILIFCWVGNEAIYTSQQLVHCAYSSNFHIFKPQSKKLLLFLMQRSLKEVHIRAGSLFRVTLSLQTFMSVMRSSYSVFAVLSKK